MPVVGGAGTAREAGQRQDTQRGGGSCRPSASDRRAATADRLGRWAVRSSLVSELARRPPPHTPVTLPPGWAPRAALGHRVSALLVGRGSRDTPPRLPTRAVSLPPCLLGAASCLCILCRVGGRCSGTGTGEGAGGTQALPGTPSPGPPPHGWCLPSCPWEGRARAEMPRGQSCRRPHIHHFAWRGDQDEGRAAQAPHLPAEPSRTPARPSPRSTSAASACCRPGWRTATPWTSPGTPPCWPGSRTSSPPR